MGRAAAAAAAESVDTGCRRIGIDIDAFRRLFSLRARTMAAAAFTAFGAKRPNIPILRVDRCATAAARVPDIRSADITLPTITTFARQIIRRSFTLLARAAAARAFITATTSATCTALTGFAKTTWHNDFIFRQRSAAAGTAIMARASRTAAAAALGRVDEFEAVGLDVGVAAIGTFLVKRLTARAARADADRELDRIVKEKPVFFDEAARAAAAAAAAVLRIDEAAATTTADQEDSCLRPHGRKVGIIGIEEAEAAVDRRVGVGDDKVTGRRIRRNHGVLVDEDLAVVPAGRDGNRLPLQLDVNLRNADNDDTAAAGATENGIIVATGTAAAAAATGKEAAFRRRMLPSAFTATINAKTYLLLISISSTSKSSSAAAAITKQLTRNVAFLALTAIAASSTC